MIATNFEKKGMGEPGEWHAQVVYMYVDWNKVLWLRNLKNMQLSDVMTSLPFSDSMQMCWGQPIEMSKDCMCIL